MSVSIAGVVAQIMLSVISLPYPVAEQSELVIPVMKAAFNAGDLVPLKVVLPHPDMVRFVPAKVCDTSGGRQIILAF